MVTGLLKGAVFEVWFAIKFDFTVSLFQAITISFWFFNDNSDIKICVLLAQYN